MTARQEEGTAGEARGRMLRALRDAVARAGGARRVSGLSLIAVLCASAVAPVALVGQTIGPVLNTWLATAGSIGSNVLADVIVSVVGRRSAGVTGDAAALERAVAVELEVRMAAPGAEAAELRGAVAALLRERGAQHVLVEALAYSDSGLPVVLAESVALLAGQFEEFAGLLSTVREEVRDLQRIVAGQQVENRAQAEHRGRVQVTLDRILLLLQEGSTPAGEAGTVHVTYVHKAPLQPVVTAGLRRDIAAFTGRERELEQILRIARPRQAVSIHTIDGMAGVGKTALAVHAAHLLKSEFPDGQYFVELRAHTPGQVPADPAEVLGGLLSELGVDPRFLPDTLAGRRDLWRDRLAHKRVLLILDDARDHAQIEPFLPAGNECVTLVTSRRRLVALDEASPFTLDILDPEPAAALFTSLARRASNTDGDRTAVAQIVRLCGYLPLAIVLLAGRLAHHPAWSPTWLANEFAAATDRLSELDVGDRAVYAAFNLSYLDLTSHQQLLFRRMGLHPGSGVDVYSMAALADIPVEIARHELEALYTDHLLDETIPGRYRLHDLLRAYARTLTTSDPDGDNDEALDRLLDYYQRTAGAADQWLSRHTHPSYDLPEPLPSGQAPHFGDEWQAMAWMRAERANLLTCLERTSTSRPARVVVLTGLLAGLLEWDGPWPQARQLHLRAAEIADRLGDQLGRANALSDLGVLCWRTAAYGEAAELHQQALKIYRDLGNRLGQAHAMDSLGSVRWNTEVYGEAADLHQHALKIYRDLGDRLGQAHSLNALGLVRWEVGAYGEASDLLRQALMIFQELGRRRGEAHALNNLGLVYLRTGVYGDAADLLQRALTIYRDLDNRLGQALSLDNLGFVRSRTGAFSEAVDLHQQSLKIHREIGSRLGQAQALNRIGAVLLATDAPEQVLGMFTEALDLARTIGSLGEQARALDGIARVRAGLGDNAMALVHMREAVAIYRRIGAPETDTAVTFLAAIESS